MKKAFRRALCLMLILLLALQAVPVLAEEAASTRWADASDEIDRYLATAFEEAVRMKLANCTVSTHLEALEDARALGHEDGEE